MKKNSPAHLDTLTEPSASPVKGAPLPTEEEYHARIDADFEAKGVRLRRNKRNRWIATVVILGGAIGGVYFWYHSSPENQEQFHGVITEAVAVKDALKEGTDVKGMMESYDVALDEISTHGDTVDAAAAALNGTGELNLEHPSKRAAIELNKSEQSKEPVEVAETTETAEVPNSTTTTPRTVTRQDVSGSTTTPERRGF